MSSSTNAATKPAKFLFDARFDVASGAHNIDDELPRYNALEMEKAREEAFIDGQETGYKKAVESIEHDISVKLEVLGTQLKDALEFQENMGKSIFRETLKVTMLMVQRILPLQYEKAAKEEIEAVVKECFESLLTQSRVVIHVHEKFVESLEKRAHQIAEKVGFDGRISVLPENSVDVIDCSVEWAEGGVHKVTQNIWQKFEIILERYGVSLELPKSNEQKEASALVEDDVSERPEQNK